MPPSAGEEQRSCGSAAAASPVLVLQPDHPLAEGIHQVVMGGIGKTLWTIYGCYTGDCPLIVANLVTLVPEGIVLERKLQAVRATRK